MQPNNQEPEPTAQPEIPTPTPAQPNASTSGGLTLQPLSSEEDIRREIAENTPQQSPVQSSASTDSPESESQNVPSPTGQASAPVVIPPLPSKVPTPPEKHKSPWLKRILVTVLLLILAGGAVLTWAFFTVSSYTVKESDLIDEKAEATTYLRPKQWTVTGKGFGDGLGKDGKSSSVMLVNVSPVVSQLVNASPELQNLAKQQAESSLSDEKLRDMMSGGTYPCTSVPEIKRGSDLASIPEMDSLMSIDASCEREDGHFMFKMKIYLGKPDGRLRVMGLGAGAALWDTNGAVYEKILGSMRIPG